MASGTLPVYENDENKGGGLPGRETWEGLDVPTYLIAGDADTVTSPAEVEKIARFMENSHPVQIELDERSEPVINNRTNFAANSQQPDEQCQDQDITALERERDGDSNEEDPSTPMEDGHQAEAFSSHFAKPQRVLKTTILPAPAGHALLYVCRRVLFHLSHC